MWMVGFIKLFKGRRALTTMIYMVLIAVSIFVYLQFEVTPLMDSICLIAIGFLIYGPVMLIGVHALDLAPKKAAGTAAGFTGFFGYFFGNGPLFANGCSLGYIVQHLGWNWNFIVLLGACALAFLFIAFTYKEEQLSPEQKQNPIKSMIKKNLDYRYHPGDDATDHPLCLCTNLSADQRMVKRSQ